MYTGAVHMLQLVTESTLEVRLWEKIPYQIGESNLHQHQAGPNLQPAEPH